MLNISIPPEVIGSIGPLPITNTLLSAWLAMAVLTILAFIFKRSLKHLPGAFQNAIEMTVEGVLDFMENVAGDRRTAEKFFPVVGTIFLFILTANWLGVFPGLGSIGFFEGSGAAAKFVPLFRSTYSDLTMTLALAVTVVVMSHIVGLVSIGVKHHLGKFISFKSPIAFIVGLLEIVSEVAKIISLSFRLFGNIFAGEILLLIITFLVPYVAAVPFLGLEIFVGFIQALIFAVLAMMFFGSATREAH